MRRGDRPGSRRRLVELVQICGACFHRVERATQHAHDKIEPPIAIEISGGGRIVTARLERGVRREWNPVAVKVGMSAAALVAEPEEPGLEEVAPEDVGVAVAIDVEHRHGVRSEEHTSELQSQSNLVCRLLLAKK